MIATAKHCSLCGAVISPGDTLADHAAGYLIQPLQEPFLSLGRLN